MVIGSGASGGLRGAPVELTRCKTCELEVPATAEVVIEFEGRWAIRQGTKSRAGLRTVTLAQSVIDTLRRQQARVAEEAGAVFVKVALMDGNAMLFTPAPQTVYDDVRPIDRFFVPVWPQPVPEASVEERLAKEIRFDPDA